MKLQLTDTITQYLNNKATGFLSVKIKGGQHLVKIYFVQGLVSNLQFGMSRNEECFPILDAPEVESVHFMKDVRCPVNGADSDGLTRMLCSHIGSKCLAGQGASSHSTVKADTVAQTIDDFIAIVGPIGQITLSDLYTKLRYRPGEPMAGDSFTQFVHQLSAELPEQYRLNYSKTHIAGG